jgi:L-ornithine Nalpha-acyltransferase
MEKPDSLGSGSTIMDLNTPQTPHQAAITALMPAANNALPLLLPLNAILGRIGTLEIRLAKNAKDVRRAQRLRYKVFMEERGAWPDARSQRERRDQDAFDGICDHLIVVDTEAQPLKAGGRIKPRVVGTYRLLLQDIAEKHSGFYSQSEFDVALLVKRHPQMRFLELGRSCVAKAYRNKRTMELLWHGIWAYVRHHRIDVMFGCASFEGTDPDAHASSLAFLHHHAAALPAWSAPAIAPTRITCNGKAFQAENARMALISLPPLIKGYLRLGARIGDGAVIDPQFGTTDVLIILKVADIDPRYIAHYGADASRDAA